MIERSRVREAVGILFYILFYTQGQGLLHFFTLRVRDYFSYTQGQGFVF